MAFEQLGFSMVVQGAAQFARDIGYLNSAIIRYQRAMDNLENQVTKEFKAEEKVASARIALATKTYQRTSLQYNQSTLLLQQYQANLAAVGTAITNMVSRGVMPTTQMMDQYQQWRNQVNQQSQEVVDSYQRMGMASEELGLSLNDAVYAHNNLVNAQKNFGKSSLNVGTILSVLTGSFGKTFLSSSQLGGIITKLVPQTAALSLVLDAGKIALDMFTFGVKVAVGTLQLLWNIFTKVVSIILQVASAIGRVAWNIVVSGLKAIYNAAIKVITLPFNIAINFFRSLGDSLKNIAQIAIGMNLERVLWGIGQRVRELAKEVYDAGVSFQLLEIRLRGLIQRELSETSGISFSDSVDDASKSAQELSYWISQLAVKSIFDASTIANAITLAMSYDFTQKEAKDLTIAMVKFASGMGLGNAELTKIIENMGQMRAAGKLTGTELRDLARGAFVPYNEIFKIIAKMPEAVARYGDTIKKVSDTELDWIAVREAGRTGEIDVDLFMKGFIEMANKDFPNAIENASVSMEVAQSNIRDFIESVLGWRVLKPTLDIVSKSITDFTTKLNSVPNQQRFARIGELIAKLFDKIFTIGEKVAPDWGTIVTDALDRVIWFLRILDDLTSGLFFEATEDAAHFALGNNELYQIIKTIIKFIQDNKPTIDAFLRDPLTWIKDNGIQALKDLANLGIQFALDKWNEFKLNAETWVTQNGQTVVKYFAQDLLQAMGNFALFLEQKFGPGSPITVVWDILKQLVSLGADWVMGLMPNVPTFNEYGLYSGMSDTGNRFGGPGAIGTIQKDIESLKKSLDELVEQGLKKVDEFMVKNVPGWKDFKQFWADITPLFKDLWDNHATELFDSIGEMFGANPSQSNATFLDSLEALIGTLINITATALDAIKFLVDLFKFFASGINFGSTIQLIDAIIKLINAMNQWGMEEQPVPNQLNPTEWDKWMGAVHDSIDSGMKGIRTTTAMNVDLIVAEIARIRTAMVNTGGTISINASYGSGPNKRQGTASSNASLMVASPTTVNTSSVVRQGNSYNLNVTTTQSQQTVVSQFEILKMLSV